MLDSTLLNKTLVDSRAVGNLNKEFEGKGIRIDVR